MDKCTKSLLIEKMLKQMFLTCCSASMWVVLLLKERIVGWQSLAVLFIHFSVALFNTRKILLKEHEVLFYMTK